MKSDAMMPPGKNKSSTEQRGDDKEYILQLPLRTIIANETVYKGYYDESTLKVFLADENGNLTGKVARLTKPLPPPENIDKNAGENSVPDETAKNMLQKTKDEAAKHKKALIEKRDKALSSTGKMDKEKKGIAKGVVVALIVAAIAGGCIFAGMNYMSSRMQPFMGNTAVTEPKDGEITVIQLNCELIAGDQITDDMIRAYNIDSETYNQITSNGSDLYRWEQRDSVVGMYATEYIAKGKYITTNSVIRSYTVPDNPFCEISDGMTLVDVPITIKDQDFDRTKLLIGSKINIDYVVNIQEDNTAETKDTKSNGVKVTAEKNVTTTDSYRIDGAVAADLLTSTGESLYEKYMALSAIPEINQESYLKSAVKANKEYMSSIAPARVCIIIDTEYADALKRAVSSNSEITMTMAEGEDTGTTEKSEFVNAQRKLMESFSAVLEK